MSLFSSIQLANNSLRAMQVGLQVVGQNIANANTPGYIREEVALTPAPTQRFGNLLLGLGVNVTAIVQKIDHFVEERLRGATSDRVSAETQENTFLQLEGLIGELGDTDLSTSLTNFFNSISEVLNQPESVSIRNLAVLQAQTLTADFNRIAKRVLKIGNDLNDRVVTIGDDINRLTTEIQTLNLRIASMEGGGSNPSDAVGLRDLRGVALSKLAELVDVRVHEQPSGAVNVYVGGDYLVLEGVRREVAVQKTSGGGVPKAEIQLAETKSPLQFQGGELAGLIAGRDTILAGFLGELDDYAATLSFEFNKIFAGGQGLTGYQSIASERAVDDTTLALNAAGLSFAPINGSFDLLVHNKQTGLTSTSSIRIDLNGFDGDTSLDGLAAQINAVDGLSASISVDRKLSIRSTNANTEFAFGNDTSGVLASLGINTLFSGESALNLGVSDTMSADPSKFAASGGGIGEDTDVGVQLAALLERPLDTQGGNTLLTLYDRLIGNVTQGSTVAQSVAEGSRTFEETLLGQSLAISGVNLDEEAVRMITYQRAYQASARYIATISELLDILVNL